MTIRRILTYPHPILRKKAAPVTEYDATLMTLANDMAATMYDAPGIGLAAPQIGESIMMIVVDVSREEDEKKFMVLINPKITESEGSQVDEEGCLSVVDLTANVKRKQKVRVSYQDMNGEPHTLEAEDRLAVVFQHEIDHLHGILFVDHLSSLKRSLYKKKLKKALKRH